MPSSTPPADNKSRQSSGGRSFFGRKIHKEKSTESRYFEDGNLAPITSNTSSAAGSKSSRHSNRPSIVPADIDTGAEGSGLSMTAGVITSMPYESLAADNKTPIPVDYLPRNDQVSARKEPLPHHLNKGGGDYHQYPAWDGQNAPTNGSSHPTGPRPPPHSSQAPSTTSSSRDRLQQAARPSTSSSTVNGSHGTFPSYSTTDSSTNARNSFDQASIYSSISSATRGSSLFSSDNSSRTAIPSHAADNSLRPSTSHSASRLSINTPSGWHPQQSSAAGSATATSFNPEGFNLPRPSDEKVIEAQFLALMHKRGWQHLPDQARRQMMAYPAAKKWTLVHQDKLTEWQGEQKRRAHARQTIQGSDGSFGILGRADEEGSPEWFVRKVMDDSITAKQLQSLSVSLRTQPIR